MTINIYAIVESGTVANVILWDGNTETWSPPSGTTANLLPQGSPVCPGYTFDGTNYTAPAAVSQTQPA
jgi:hypothetical protein